MDSVINEIFKQITKSKIVAIDGFGGSGKSTLAKIIKGNLNNIEIIHTDDFYKTKELRQSSKGDFNCENYDYERLIKQVIEPFINNEKITFEKYDWTNDTVNGKYSISNDCILVIEGVQSLRKELINYYDYKIWVETPYDLRLNRGMNRDGEQFRELWVKEWMPSELEYKNDHLPHLNADIILSGEGKNNRLSFQKIKL
ncbi:MAG: (d)CMP kinase [Candidatus Izemoplasma sp.]